MGKLIPPKSDPAYQLYEFDAEGNIVGITSPNAESVGVIRSVATAADLQPASSGAMVLQVSNTGRIYGSVNEVLFRVEGGFIPTIFNVALEITTQVLIEPIADWVSKLGITNSGASAIYVAFADTVLSTFNSVSDINGSKAIKIGAGESFQLSVVGSRFFALVSESGSNAVNVTQGV